MDLHGEQQAGGASSHAMEQSYDLQEPNAKRQRLDDRVDIGLTDTRALHDQVPSFFDNISSSGGALSYCQHFMRGEQPKSLSHTTGKTLWKTDITVKCQCDLRTGNVVKMK